MICTIVGQIMSPTKHPVLGKCDIEKIRRAERATTSFPVAGGSYRCLDDRASYTCEDW